MRLPHEEQSAFTRLRLPPPRRRPRVSPPGQNNARRLAPRRLRARSMLESQRPPTLFRERTYFRDRGHDISPRMGSAAMPHIRLRVGQLLSCRLLSGARAR